ncbi:histidine kinase [Candidatus Nitrososphaera evergladensis SR1]|jgi:two-component system sensor histidine kinase VicK|uniref:histidine kinase n=1 Tax=Candidatus Nitrososphaera evergladensis SR1 TaxID=1459636 RepID=A0A075MR29_9ARCH|nr:HAMP domain-containing sensor histidine kinase [Candidatus Nitrososphaera evergladensis]AIF83555.1 histidine kinase [Candidatus Nitrososphaera evergladensis SR1]
MMSQQLSDESSTERHEAGTTRVLYGAEKAVGMGIKFMSNVKKRMDISFDSRGASIVVEVPAYWNGYLDIKSRGGQIRVVTEITKANLHYCKRLAKIAQVRHLNGMTGGIAVNETEYMATTTLEEAKPLTQVIYSNVEEVVRQGHCLFEILWENSIPAQDRFREIEEGVEPERTRVLYGADRILNQVVECFSSIKYTFDNCTDSAGPSIFLGNEPLKTEYSKLKDRGVKLRFITEITRDNVSYCKQLMRVADVRHLNKVRGNFGIVDKRLYAASGVEHQGKIPSRLVTSTIRAFVEQQQYFFETLWKKAMPAEQKIREIEEGVKPEYIVTINDPDKVQKIAFDLANSAKSEILVMFSTANAFHRQERAGGVQLLMDAARKRNVKVRILTPFDDRIGEVSRNVREELVMRRHDLEKTAAGDIDIKYTEPTLQTKISLLIVDSRFSLAVELEDDAKETTSEAIGLATLSNSKATVSSYVSMFESMWRQNELLEKLKAHSKMQQEFINIAAHELRSPIQPIMGLSELLYFKATNDQQRELADIIRRNAERLHRLAENILDVTRIESQSLRLDKEQFSLKELLEDTIRDYKKSPDYNNNNNNNSIQLIYPSEKIDDDIFVQADKERIKQVISNLLSNAFGFTRGEGTVLVTVEREKRDDGSGQFVIVSVRDSGSGIAPEILPIMFEKFTTKSEKGTGLGLFISKGIIEAHGGRIWGKNNDDDDRKKGATFTFTLPTTIIVTDQQQDPVPGCKQG